MLRILITFGRHCRVRGLLVMLEFQRQFVRFHVIDLLKKLLIFINRPFFGSGEVGGILSTQDNL